MGGSNNRSSEKWLERTLREAVTARGGAAVKLVAAGAAGLPDRLILWPGGRAEFVELKSTGQRLRPLQRLAHERLGRLGFACTVIDNETDLQKWLNLRQELTSRRSSGK